MFFISLGIVLIGGFLTGLLFEKIKLPKIVGMIIIGILMGPSVLNIIDDSIIAISSYLRQIALVIILTRSGLSLNIKNLKKIGRPAVLMCFVPATLEMIGVILFTPVILNITILEALLLGTILAAVSPAIVVPRMIKLKEEGYGEDKNISELVMAGSSADDIYVIVLFYAFLGLSQGQEVNALVILQIPLSIVLGVILGVLAGIIVNEILKRKKVNLTIQILIVLSLSFLMLGFEEIIKKYVSISGLIAIITLGMVILLKSPNEAKEIENGYSKIWVFFEILLFVLVGISVDLNYAISAGFMSLLVLVIGLIFRTIGVYLSLLFTKLNFKEKLFIIFSYLPKATVQASIGGLALQAGLESGSLMLTMAVLSILVTAPLGAILMDKTYKKLLKKIDTVGKA